MVPEGDILALETPSHIVGKLPTITQGDSWRRL